MSDSIPVTCPHCGRTAKLKSAAALGRTIPCRGCGEPFTLRADDDFADGFEDDFADLPPAAPAPRRAGRRSERATGRRKKSSGGVPVWAWALGGTAGVLLICGGGLVALLLPAVNAARDAARDRQTNFADAAEAAKTTPPAPIAAATEEQARALGEAIETAFNTQDVQAMTNLIDAEGLMTLALSGLDLPANERRAAINGFRGSRSRIAQEWLALTRAGADARMLGVIERDDGPAALIRLLPPEGGVAYIAYFPTLGGQIADAHVFSTGERMSTSMRRLFSMMFDQAAQQGGVDSTLLNRLQQFRVEGLSGDSETALRLYAGFPASLQDTRFAQMIRVSAASRLNDEDRYREVLADVDRRYPNDPSLDLLKVDYYADEPAQLVATLERLDQAVGGDPFLRGLLAEHLPDIGRDEDALARGRKAVEEEPDLLQAQVGLLSGQIAVGDFEAAADVLRTVRDEFSVTYTPAELQSFYPRAAEFVESDAYRTMRAEPPRGFGG